MPRWTSSLGLGFDDDCFCVLRVLFLGFDDVAFVCVFCVLPRFASPQVHEGLRKWIAENVSASVAEKVSANLL